ncbi:hypothetical protein K466DRAFT_563166 [Polyporus arcularius HHB13444]|uniref:F-box domain-containing protein n=1 Tax=Polyporus arcularius HHB13444 TaxID=1314778 RepID=A0A5C3PY84_9APHY|nr:hypothetical protein K466DRAFT_563166 [Polyporus arcularius HHB13444]
MHRSKIFQRKESRVRAIVEEEEEEGRGDTAAGFQQRHDFPLDGDLVIMVATTRSRSKQDANSALPRLPAEVLLMAIEQLLDDKPSLSSCCLVARSWLSLGRICLFRRVTIYSEKGGPDRFHDFLCFLQRCDVGRYVRELTLSAPPGGFDPMQDSDEVLYQRCTPCSVDTMQRTLSHICSLRELNVSHLLLTATSEVVAAESIPARGRPTLDYLSIEGCSAHNQDAGLLYELICMFSDIGTLEFTCGPWKPVVASTLFGERTTLPLIRKLDMYGEYQATTDGTFELLRRSGSLEGALTQLEFVTIFSTILPAFFSFIPDAATHLVTLNLMAFGVFCEHRDGTPYPLRLPLFPALRRLGLDIEIDSDDAITDSSDYVRNAVNVYADLLSTSSSFPVLNIFRLYVSDSSLALRTFNHSAERTDAWRRFGEALIALPAISSIRFDFADVVKKRRLLERLEHRRRAQGLLMKFFEQHIPALWHYDCRVCGTAPAGQGKNPGVPTPAARRVHSDERTEMSTGGIPLIIVTRIIATFTDMHSTQTTPSLPSWFQVAQSLASADCGSSLTPEGIIEGRVGQRITGRVKGSQYWAVAGPAGTSNLLRGGATGPRHYTTQIEVRAPIGSSTRPIRLWLGSASSPSSATYNYAEEVIFCAEDQDLAAMVATTRRKAKQNAFLAFRRLPTEVLLMVLEELSDDKQSLLSCCLVSHKWLSLGRTFLFRTVSIVSTKDGPDLFSGFLCFLQHSDMGKHVRKLTLSAPPLSFFPEDVTPLDENPDDLVYHLCTPCSIDTVRHILDHTAGLRDLNLHLLLFTPSGCPLAINARRPILDSLCLRNCTALNKNPELFFEVICTFSDIGTLSFMGGPWSEPVPPDRLFSQRLGELPLIHGVYIYGKYEATTYGTFDLLRRSGSLNGTLTEFEIETTYDNIIYSFLSFLPEAATHLVYLNLESFCAFCEHPEGTPYPLRFPLFPALRRLGLEIDLDTDDYLPLRSRDVRNVINVYVHLLSASSSFPVLTRVDFHIIRGVRAPETFRHSAERTPAWRLLGEALVALPAIAAITFVLADIPAEERREIDPIVDWRTGTLMQLFFEHYVPALYAKRPLYSLLHDNEAAGYESDNDRQGSLDGDREYIP